ncbi:hypothetical protein DFQ04_2436 [Algoriphagus boseongensis]|uniref:Uncharacterized protein n=1 Tax=Algoriphagus boseongensis TaxID=1442587 RepID=A0A4R6T4X0_9BACT|nr:hypothetical protein [Algoriphagus boseongensis]TDQ16319.1 hypothetical protein DFQ04_2436 [Algoriphagus boseongensis]
MSKKIIDRSYGLPFALIILILLIQYLDLFVIPAWILGGVISWAAVTFILVAIRRREKGN